MQSKKIISCWALVIFGMVIILLSACKNDVKLPKKEVNGLPDDFVEFYNTFHTDSLQGEIRYVPFEMRCPYEMCYKIQQNHRADHSPLF